MLRFNWRNLTVPCLPLRSARTASRARIEPRSKSARSHPRYTGCRTRPLRASNRLPSRVCGCKDDDQRLGGAGQRNLQGVPQTPRLCEVTPKRKRTANLMRWMGLSSSPHCVAVLPAPRRRPPREQLPTRSRLRHATREAAAAPTARRTSLRREPTGIRRLPTSSWSKKPGKGASTFISSERRFVSST